MNPYTVIKPIITEKSLRLASVDNTYTFLVQTSATKGQIKETVTKLFAVEVETIRTIVNQKEKRRTGKRRLAATTGKAKKALVTLKQGHTIDLFDLTQKEN